MRSWKSRARTEGRYGLSFEVVKVAPVEAGGTIAATVKADEIAGEIEDALGEGFVVGATNVVRLPDPIAHWSPMEAPQQERE